MSAYALVSVGCPHCRGQFLENAKLVRPGGQAYCPNCEELFVLDMANTAMRTTLIEAKLARRRRKERLAELRSRWADPVPAPAQKPMQMSDVLRALDNLLERMDDLAQREKG
ncbi:MAG: hypothetical protein ACO1OG_05065 [Devosia sp.]